MSYENWCWIKVETKLSDAHQIEKWVKYVEKKLDTIGILCKSKIE